MRWGLFARSAELEPPGRLAGDVKGPPGAGQFERVVHSGTAGARFAALVQRSESMRGWGDAHVSGPLGSCWGVGAAHVSGCKGTAGFGDGSESALGSLHGQDASYGQQSRCPRGFGGVLGCLLGEHPRFDPLALRVALAGGLAPLLAGRYGARTPRAEGRSPLGPLRRGSPARVGTGDGAVPQSVRGKRSLARGGLGQRGSAVIAEATPATPEHFAGGALCGVPPPAFPKSCARADFVLHRWRRGLLRERFPSGPIVVRRVRCRVDLLCSGSVAAGQ